MRSLVFQFIRFAGIGFLNTAVDFAVLNLFASAFGAYTGVSVALVNGISFTVAVLHSYFWNKYWAFGSHHDDQKFLKNIGQFLSAAILGAAIIVLVVVGAGFKYGAGFYVAMLVVLVIGEIGLWKFFRLKGDPAAKKSGREVFLFIAVSLVGVLINSGIVGGVTGVVAPPLGLNQELWTNIVKAAATAVALIWNFVGYKLIVFKK